jgi:hypothetical protein
MSKTATWVGEDGFEIWSGFDGDTLVTLAPGEPTEISDELADRLAADHGGLLELDGKLTEPKPATPTGPDDDPLSLEALMKNSRADLDVAAGLAGVDDPAALPNKQAVAEAIVAKVAEVTDPDA